jgi:hypothetical protein
MSPLRSSSPLLLAALAAASVLGCKGATVVKADPEVVSRLKDCAEKTKAKDDLIATYEHDLAELKLGSAAGANELVMRIDGDTLAITARPTGPGLPAVEDKVAIELGNQFVANVRKSRGNIQKCYEQALKKNSAIQARTITLQVSAKFNATGAVSKSDFRPDLGPAFDNCMQSVATRWKLTPQAQGMSFQTTVTLSPS